MLDLNGATSGTITAPLANRAHWTNVCGPVATNTAPHPGPTAACHCVGGTDPAVSPYDGFTNAMKHVKQVNLAFGSAGSYASGVAAVGTDAAAFDMASFTVTPWLSISAGDGCANEGIKVGGGFLRPPCR